MARCQITSRKSRRPLMAELTDSEGKVVATARAELRVRERKNRP
jgi:hypothetical protein